MVRPGEVIAWKESRMQREFFKALTVDIPRRPVPPWLNLDTAAMTGTVSSLPAAEDLESAIDTRLIVEYYSR
jgi:small subunit ribosomal protein S4